MWRLSSAIADGRSAVTASRSSPTIRSEWNIASQQRDGGSLLSPVMPVTLIAIAGPEPGGSSSAL